MDARRWHDPRDGKWHWGVEIWRLAAIRTLLIAVIWAGGATLLGCGVTTRSRGRAGPLRRALQRRRLGSCPPSRVAGERERDRTVGADRDRATVASGCPTPAVRPLGMTLERSIIVLPNDGDRAARGAPETKHLGVPLIRRTGISPSRNIGRGYTSVRGMAVALSRADTIRAANPSSDAELNNRSQDGYRIEKGHMVANHGRR